MKILNTSFIILMITFLVTSLNIDLNSGSSAFVQIKLNKKSEALFATLAIQLTDQSEGYDRAIATLTSLIEAAKQQDFQNTLTWRKTDGLCHVSAYKLKERQEYFDGNLQNYKNIIDAATTSNAESKDSIASKESAEKVYNEVLVNENQVHNREQRILKDLADDATEGLTKCENAINAVQNWVTESQNEDVEIKIKDVTYTYEKVTRFKVVVPLKALDEGYKNTLIKQTLLTWLGELKIQFFSRRNDLNNLIEKRNKLNNSIDNEIKDLNNILRDDIKQLNELVENNNTLLSSISKDKDSYIILSSKNREIIDANENYCRTEKMSYEKYKEDFQNSIKLYTDTRLYFKENYATFKEFLKNKYRNIQ